MATRRAPKAARPVPLFPLGQIVATAGVAADVPPPVIRACLARHAAGDWGTVGTDDAQANVDALREGDRLLSAYETGAGKVWIITEADRASTTVLFPSEY